MSEHVRSDLPRDVLDPYARAQSGFVGVVDANAILSSIDNDCRTGRRARLLRMSDTPSITLFAPDHVWHEVYEKLPKIAASSSAPVDDLRSYFESEYLTNLRFVTMTPPVDADACADVTDLDDRPLAQLARLVAPCIVFSEDKHLRKPGLAPPNWREVAGHGADLAAATEDQRVTTGIVLLPGFGLLELTKFIGRRLGIAPWLVGFAFLGAGVGFLRRPERRQAAAEVLGPLAETFSKLIMECDANLQAGIEKVGQHLVAADPEPSLRSRVAIVLTRSSEPLLVREIRALVTTQFSSEHEPSEHEVRAVVEAGSEFVHPRGERYRWQFGRQAGPRVEA